MYINDVLAIRSLPVLDFEKFPPCLTLQKKLGNGGKAAAVVVAAAQTTILIVVSFPFFSSGRHYHSLL